jgi:DNA topoisomerase-1
VKYGSKYASLKEDDPYTVTLERAREVIRLKQEADAARLIQDFPEAGIQVLNGRYGPYITDKKKNAKIPKDKDPKSVTLEECRVLLAAAPERGGRFGRWGRGKKAAPAAAGTPAATTAEPKSKAKAKPKGNGKSAPPPAAAAPATTVRTKGTAPAAAAPAAHARTAAKARKASTKSTRKSAAPKARSTTGAATGRARRLK